jgi:hypothetical protein
MDKGDKILRDKLKAARPYQPTLDWEKMEGMLEKQEKAVLPRRFFLLGLLAGAASILLIGALFWGISTKDIPEVALPVTEGKSQHEQLDEKNYSENLPSPENTQVITPSHSSHSVSDKEEKQEKNTNNTSISSPTGANSPITSKKTRRKNTEKGMAFQQNEKLEMLVFEEKQLDINKAVILENDGITGSSSQKDHTFSHTSLSHKTHSSSSFPLSQISFLKNDSLDKLSNNSFAESILNSAIKLPDFQAKFYKEKKWSLGIYLSAMIQPYVAEDPVMVSENPLAYHWHPAINLIVERKLSRRWAANLNVGIDDVYYYNGFVYAGVYDAAAFNQFNNSASIIVGSNYQLSAGARFIPRRKEKAIFKPYLEGNIGAALGRTDFLEIFNVDSSQLSASNKSSRLSARQNLENFTSNTYLVNRSDLISGSSESTDVFSTYQAAEFQPTNYLSSSQKTNYLHLQAGVGTEIRLGEAWSLDIGGKLIHRTNLGQYSRNNLEYLAMNVDVSSSPTNQGTTYSEVRQPQSYSFFKLSAGLKWKF